VGEGEKWVKMVERKKRGGGEAKVFKSSPGRIIIPCPSAKVTKRQRPRARFGLLRIPRVAGGMARQDHDRSADTIGREYGMGALVP
jgi:hypothetical protein